MPTTAIVIPAKYVYVSPTKTEDGNLEDVKKDLKRSHKSENT